MRLRSSWRAGTPGAPSRLRPGMAAAAGYAAAGLEMINAVTSHAAPTAASSPAWQFHKRPACAARIASRPCLTGRTAQPPCSARVAGEDSGCGQDQVSREIAEQDVVGIRLRPGRLSSRPRTRRPHATSTCGWSSRRQQPCASPTYWALPALCGSTPGSARPSPQRRPQGVTGALRGESDTAGRPRTAGPACRFTRHTGSRRLLTSLTRGSELSATSLLRQVTPRIAPSRPGRASRRHKKGPLRCAGPSNRCK